MKINLNDTVKVVLTEAGVKLLQEYYNSFSVKIRNELPTYKAGDSYQAQLWRLFEIFGKGIYLCCSEPFDNCEIILGD